MSNRMIQNFTETHTFYTSREYWDCQILHVEYPCNIDGTTFCKHHTLPFDQHQLFQAIGRSNEGQSLNVLYARGFSLIKSILESG